MCALHLSMSGFFDDAQPSLILRRPRSPTDPLPRVVWCLMAQAPPLVRQSGLDCDREVRKPFDFSASRGRGTLVSMNRVLSVVFVAGSLLLLAGCSSGTTNSPPTDTATPSPSTATPSASETPTAGQCNDEDLEVTITTGEPAAGSVLSVIEFTNTGTETCELRGAPQVSVVREDGTEVGAPAKQEEPADPPTIALPAGGKASAALTAVNIVPDGGPLAGACLVTTGDGYRVYPPHGTTAFFVPAAGTPACEGETVWLTVANVLIT